MRNLNGMIGRQVTAEHMSSKSFNLHYNCTLTAEKLKTLIKKGGYGTNYTPQHNYTRVLHTELLAVLS